MIILTPYMTIFKRFQNKITDFKILDMDDYDVLQMMILWMDSSISKFKKVQTDLSQRDNETLTFSSDLLDIEIEILSMMMVTEWLEPQLNSELYTSQFFGGKEEKFYAQSNQLEKLMTLKHDNDVACRKRLRDYGYRQFIENNG